MKKLVSILLVLSLGAMLVPAAAEEEIVGRWYLNRAETQGVNMVVISDEMNMTLDFRADGTGTSRNSLPGEESVETEITWSYEDGVVVMTNLSDGSVSRMPVENGEMCMDYQDVRMYLGRNPHMVYEQPAAVKAESIGQFYGSWYPAAAFISGMMAMTGDSLPREQIATLRIGADAITETSAEGDVTAYQNPVLDSETGMLVATLPVEGYEATVFMALLEDGTLLLVAFLNVSGTDMEITRIIYRNDAAAAEGAA